MKYIDSSHKTCDSKSVCICTSIPTFTVSAFYCYHMVTAETDSDKPVSATPTDWEELLSSQIIPEWQNSEAVFRHWSWGGVYLVTWRAWISEVTQSPWRTLEETGYIEPTSTDSSQEQSCSWCSWMSYHGPDGPSSPLGSDKADLSVSSNLPRLTQVPLLTPNPLEKWHQWAGIQWEYSTTSELNSLGTTLCTQVHRVHS